MATVQLIQSLNTVVSRRINIINNPAVVSVGMVEAGTETISSRGTMLMGTIRTFDPELKEIYNEIRQIAEGVAQGQADLLSSLMWVVSIQSQLTTSHCF